MSSPVKKPVAASKKAVTPQQKLSVKRNKTRGKFRKNKLEPRLRDIENEVDPVESKLPHTIYYNSILIYGPSVSATTVVRILFISSRVLDSSISSTEMEKIHKLYTLIAVNKNNTALWGPVQSSVKVSFKELHDQLEDLRHSTKKFLSSRCDKAHVLEIIRDTKLDSDESKLEKISAAKSVIESLEEKELSVLDKIAPCSEQSTMLKLSTMGGVMTRSSEARATDKTALVPTTTATNSPEAGERKEYHSPTWTSTSSSKRDFSSLSGIVASVKPTSKRKHDDPGPDPGGRHNVSNKRRKTAAASSHCVSFGLECEPNERTDDGKPYHGKGRIKQNRDNSVSSQMFLEVQATSNQKSQQIGELQLKVEELEYRLKFRNNNPNPTTKKLQGRHDELLTSYQRNKKKNEQLQAQLEGVKFVSDQYFRALKKKNQSLCLYPRKEIYLNLSPHRYFPDLDLELLRAQNTWLDNEIQHSFAFFPASILFTQRRTLASIARRRGEKALAEQQH